MSWPARQSRLYHSRRAELVELLGGVCSRKIEDPTHKCKGKLTIQHNNGRDWIMRKTSSHQRVKRLWEEARRGELSLLCHFANTSDGQRFRGRKARMGTGWAEGGKKLKSRCSACGGTGQERRVRG